MFPIIVLLCLLSAFTAAQTGFGAVADDVDTLSYLSERVYGKVNSQSDIFEWKSDDGSPWVLNCGADVGLSSMHSGVAAVSWYPPGATGLEIRVFYCNATDMLVSWLFSPNGDGWVQDPNFPTGQRCNEVRGSVAAVEENYGDNIHVYVHSPDHGIRELIWTSFNGTNGVWDSSEFFYDVNENSNIAAVIHQGEIDLFFQMDWSDEEVLGVQWHSGPNGWNQTDRNWGSSRGTVPEGAALAAVGFGFGPNDPQIRLYVGNHQDNTDFLVLHWFNGGFWWNSQTIQSTKGAMQSITYPIGANWWYDGVDFSIRLYFVGITDAIQEWGCDACGDAILPNLYKYIGDLPTGC